jgi:hypothetical protein
MYQNCVQCVTWLGEQDENTQEALRLVDFFANNNHFYEWSNGYLHSLTDESQMDEDAWRGHFEQNPDLFRPLEALMKHLWWSRVWTVQEFALPSIVEIKCGSIVFDWWSLIDALNNMELHNNSCCAPFMQGLTDNMTRIHFQFGQLLRSLKFLRKAWTFSKSRKLNMLLTMMTKRGPRDATDPRDRIYATLGMVIMDSGSMIEPNYNPDFCTVYSQLVAHQIKGTKPRTRKDCRASTSNLDSRLVIRVEIVAGTTTADEKILSIQCVWGDAIPRRNRR